MITEDQLETFLPNMETGTREGWVAALNKAFEKYDMDDPDAVAALLAQCAHESAEFTRLQENLNYSAERLMAVWPKRFPTLDVAAKYAHNPAALASYVYSGRGGNGDESSGDGWRYRGRGLLQITFKNNYLAVQQQTRLPVVVCPDMLCTKDGAAAAAVTFWQANHLTFLAAFHGGDD